MELLNALGINHYAIVQFFIFILVFVFLTQVVFGPFLKAHEGRLQRTKGGEQLADEYSAKTQSAQAEYAEKAREIHTRIQSIFQKSRTEAMGDYDRIVAQARKEAEALVETNRQAVATASAQASTELKGQTTQVALAITNKLLGK